jgi:hypothetical protein
MYFNTEHYVVYNLWSEIFGYDFGRNFGFGMCLGFGLVQAFGFGQNFSSKCNQKPKYEDTIFKQ